MARRIGWLVLGFVIAIVLFVVGGYVFVNEGGVPMATSSAPLPFEKTVARMALRASDRQAASEKNPLPLSDDNLAAGATVYRDHCAVCHGRPGQTSEFARAMFPQPPQLFAADQMVTDDPEGITYWKVTNGIRLSGMPGFGQLLSDDQRWQATMLVAHADTLSDRAKSILASAQPH
ncbi:MAG: c-type cytochrome [Vicinamibacterales bacterium]